MDDYFSGLIRPHIEEMRLEEEDGPSGTPSEDEDKEDKEISKEEFDVKPTDDVTSERVTTSTRSTSSTSSTSSSSNVCVSLKDYQYPTFNYEKEYSTQYLAAVVGREFDEPHVIATKLQQLLNQTRIIKFIPFTVRRSVLVKGNFDWQDIKGFDVVCLCYNASEARILLLGVDGYYTQLTRQLETLLGSNKVAFIITHYSTTNEDGSSLIASDLFTRLSVQTGLEKYLQVDQVLSWYQEPHENHVTKLIELAKSENNPVSSCVVL